MKNKTDIIDIEINLFRLLNFKLFSYEFVALFPAFFFFFADIICLHFTAEKIPIGNCWRSVL